MKFFMHIHVNIVYRLACITTFYDGRGIAEHQLYICGQKEKLLITLDSRGIIGSNFVYLCILTLSSHWYAKR